MSSEIQAFIAKAQESLAASKLLTANGLHDFAASRAYHTMFYIAEAFLWDKGLSFSKKGFCCVCLWPRNCQARRCNGLITP